MPFRYPIIPGESRDARRKRIRNLRQQRNRKKLTPEQRAHQLSWRRAYREKNRKRIYEVELKWRADNPEKWNAIRKRAAAKLRAKRKNNVQLNENLPESKVDNETSEQRITRVGNKTIHRLL